MWIVCDICHVGAFKIRGILNNRYGYGAYCVYRGERGSFEGFRVVEEMLEGLFFLFLFKARQDGRNFDSEWVLTRRTRMASTAYCISRVEVMCDI